MEIEKEYSRWLEKALADADVAEELISMDAAQKEDAFYRDLAFGTGGLRGVIGAGTNRMNVYTVAKATQGLANYLRSHLRNRPWPLAMTAVSRAICSPGLRRGCLRQTEFGCISGLC